MPSFLKQQSVQSIYPLLTKLAKLLCVYTEYINMVQLFGSVACFCCIHPLHSSKLLFFFFMRRAKNIIGQPFSEITDETRDDIIRAMMFARVVCIIDFGMRLCIMDLQLTCGKIAFYM